MKYLSKIVMASGIFALVLGLTFSVSQAQNHHNYNNNKNHQNNQYNNTSNRSMNQNNQMVMGKVVSQDGNAVSNAKVTIMSNGSSMNKNTRNYGMHKDTTVTTDQNGMFKLADISPGRHTIKVNSNNYQGWQNTIRIPAIRHSSSQGMNSRSNGYYNRSNNNRYNNRNNNRRYNNNNMTKSDTSNNNMAGNDTSRYNQNNYNGYNNNNMMRSDTTNNNNNMAGNDTTRYNNQNNNNNNNNMMRNDTTNRHTNRNNRNHYGQTMNNNNNNNYGTNSYSKSLFITIRLQKKQ